MRILILGKNGMLATMLFNYLQSQGMDVCCTQRDNKKLPRYLNIDERYLVSGLSDSFVRGVDYIVNCVGATRLERTDIDSFRQSFHVNAVFPVYLQRFCADHSIRIIHISTDAVFKGGVHPYYEEDTCDGCGDYALSKILGEVQAPNVLNIRCSIVGPEYNRSRNLLGWFLSQKDGGLIQGYTNHIWNGVTTLQLSTFIYHLLSASRFDDILKKTGVIHYSPNLPLSKYELLEVFKKVYGKNIQIEPMNSAKGVQRVLHSRFATEYEKNEDFLEAVLKTRLFFETNCARS